MLNFVQRGLGFDIVESILVHPTHTNGLVQSGDPIVVSTLVGVAAATAAATTDMVDCELSGVYNLSVVGSNAGGNVAIGFGDMVYIDGATAVLSANASKTPFGKALGTVNSGATTVIPVRIG